MVKQSPDEAEGWVYLPHSILSRLTDDPGRRRIEGSVDTG